MATPARRANPPRGPDCVRFTDTASPAWPIRRAGVFLGYYCHTSADLCVNDTDCAAQGSYYVHVHHRQMAVRGRAALSPRVGAARKPSFRDTKASHGRGLRRAGERRGSEPRSSGRSGPREARRGRPLSPPRQPGQQRGLGGSSSSRGWREPSRRAVAPDMPGFGQGRSAAPGISTTRSTGVRAGHLDGRPFRALRHRAGPPGAPRLRRGHGGIVWASEHLLASRASRSSTSGSSRGTGGTSSRASGGRARARRDRAARHQPLLPSASPRKTTILALPRRLRTTACTTTTTSG